MRRVVIAAILGLFAVCVLLYIGDWVQLQLREHQGSAYGSMFVQRTDIVREKGGKVEYFSNPPEPMPCVRAIFPHEGQPACWWLARHIDEQQYLN